MDSEIHESEIHESENHESENHESENHESENHESENCQQDDKGDSFLNLPKDFRQRLQAIVPKQHWQSVTKSFSQTTTPSFRVNLLSSSVEDVTSALTESGIKVTPVEWCAEAFQVSLDQRSELTHHQVAEDGSIYLHNLSSMFATLVLDPKPDETVLDLAAAPGGKTLHIASAMNGQGMLSAVEPVKNRFFRLKENLRRSGAAFVRCYMLDGRQVAAKTGARFDRVLLDAPCSSEARFGTAAPESYGKWSLKKVAECRRKQKGLIKSAFQALKPGGTLVYSTCSFSPEENEGIVASLLKKFDEAEIQPIEMPFDNWQAGLTQWEGTQWPDAVSMCRRILPNENFNGLFLAKIVKIKD